MATYTPPGSMLIGDNLYVNPNGEQYSFNKGKRIYSQSPFDSAASRLNSFYNSQKKSQLDTLKQQQTKATAGFNQQKKDLVPQYAAQRNQADVVNAQGVSRLRELMAANGINASGENVTASADLASSRQGALNNINTQQNEANAAINKQIADVNDPSQAQGIMNQIETSRSGALADSYNQYIQRMQQQQQDYQAQQWQKYMYNNMSAEQKASLGMNKYGIDANNAASGAASQAELAYYQNGLVGIP